MSSAALSKKADHYIVNNRANWNVYTVIVKVIVLTLYLSLLIVKPAKFHCIANELVLKPPYLQALL